jgi:hypothetical protein
MVFIKSYQKKDELRRIHVPSNRAWQNVQRAVAIIQQLVPGIKFKLLGTKGQACEDRRVEAG